MKKTLLLAALLALTPGLVGAAPKGDAVSTPIVSFQTYPRALQFSDSRNTVSTDGYIMVCEYPNTPNSRDATCHDEQKQNKWTPIDRLKIAGHKLTGYQWVYNYTLNSQTLILYFTPEPWK